MSILLDALRKSENSQKPVEPPTIHSNDHLMAEPESMNAGLLAVLLLVALLLIGWLVWRQYQLETEVYRPPVDLPAGRSTPAKPVTTVSGQAQEIQAPQQPAQQVPEQAARSGTARPRTPVETYEPSGEENIVSKRQQYREKVAAANAAKAQQAAAVKAAEKPLAKVAEPTDQPAQNEPYRSPEPQPIGYWDLPDSVRNGVPVIKFSVLVFADAPADRFVLINGSRYVEGDELKPGLVVEEIRRDGAVFSYQLYRFFVKR